MVVGGSTDKPFFIRWETRHWLAIQIVPCIFKHTGINSKCFSETAHIFLRTSLANVSHQSCDPRGYARAVCVLAWGSEFNTPPSFYHHVSCGVNDLLLALCRTCVSQRPSSGSRLLTCGTMVMDTAAQEQ